MFPTTGEASCQPPSPAWNGAKEPASAPSMRAAKHTTAAFFNNIILFGLAREKADRNDLRSFYPPPRQCFTPGGQITFMIGKWEQKNSTDFQITKGRGKKYEAPNGFRRTE